MRRPTFGVTARFALVLLVVVPALALTARIGNDGLSSTRDLTDTLFNDIIATLKASRDVQVEFEGFAAPINVHHDLSAHQIEMLAKGGAINWRSRRS